MSLVAGIAAAMYLHHFDHARPASHNFSSAQLMFHKSISAGGKGKIHSTIDLCACIMATLGCEALSTERDRRRK